MTIINDFTVLEPALLSSAMPPDPRQRMAVRLPQWLQPFITWLTAKPAPGEAAAGQSAMGFVTYALAWALGGAALSALPLLLAEPPAWLWLLLPLGWLATSCGLGLFQVVIFHHCSHGTVFSTRERNRIAGRMVSAFLLFKRFEDYQHEHMLHHSPNKLLTEEDEFADFVLGMCGLEPGLPKRELWRRVLVNCASPGFHLKFLQRRIRAAMFSGDRAHDRMSRLHWGLLVGAAAATGSLHVLLLAWVVPVSVLLQVATVFRILCEHRFPEPEMIQARDRLFVCHATAGVFPGKAPPELRATSVEGLLRWTAWWAEMLTVHLFVRLFVLVGDAPCHDFHHRRPATRRWVDYIHARQKDLDAGSPGFPAGYFENWGLFAAIDHNLGSLAATPRAALGR